MRKICYSKRSALSDEYLENKQRKEKTRMAPKAALLVIVIGLVSLGFVCKNTAQTPPSAQVPSGWKEYRNAQAGYSVQIPSDWNTRDSRGDGSLIGINQGPVPTRDVIDSIRIEVKENPKGLSVDEFYRQPYEVYLYEDAKGGVESMMVNGRSAMRFKDVIGLVNVEVVVIPIGTRILEIELSEPPDNRTIFERLLETMEVE